MTMAGCYGNDTFDRAMESSLMQELADMDNYTCPDCGFTATYEELYIDQDISDNDKVHCPQCYKREENRQWYLSVGRDQAVASEFYLWMRSHPDMEKQSINEAWQIFVLTSEYCEIYKTFET